ncbi:MAG: rhodanese-like domain-containing protein [Pseudomonadota bacterium]|nr:rhodanese-like domain-containing protein [Pseudomonadota bacterium]
MADILVSAEWLLANHGNVRIFDVSNHLPTANRRANDEFEEAHIPGAGRFDIDRIADPDSSLPHTVPSPAGFEAHKRALGLHDDDHVVLYDDSDIKTAARGWWMLRLFGHQHVSILNGGLTAWKLAGGTLESGAAAQHTGGSFTSRPAIGVDVVTMDRLRDGIAEGTAGQILDARAAARFAGEAPEPRKGLRAGHIPGSRNLPFSELFDDDGQYRDEEAISSLFDAAGIDTGAPVTTTCGSGVTACALAVGLALIGNENTIVYDGSWTEWGAGDAPIETGGAD